jgi:hypothetical protein
MNANRRKVWMLEPEQTTQPVDRTPRRKRSPNQSPEDVLEPAAGGPARQGPNLLRQGPNLLRQQISAQEWAYLESVPEHSLSEEIKLMRVLSLRLVQQGFRADNSGDEIRYYSEATRIMARLPQLLKAERALQSGQDDVTLAMIDAINTVLEKDQKRKDRQLKLPLEDAS